VGHKSIHSNQGTLIVIPVALALITVGFFVF
jgi:hypothetical protein